MQEKKAPLLCTLRWNFKKDQCDFKNCFPFTGFIKKWYFLLLKPIVFFIRLIVVLNLSLPLYTIMDKHARCMYPHFCKLYCKLFLWSLFVLFFIHLAYATVALKGQRHDLSSFFFPFFLNILMSTIINLGIFNVSSKFWKSYIRLQARF